MKIKFHGVRGSYPVPGPDTVRYGGNTTCVSITEEVDGAICRVIIDAGTGIISLGKEMVKNYLEKKEVLVFPIFFTHLHPDHTQGFPFFAPNFFKTAQITLAGMEALSEDVGIILSKTMMPPQFPIQYNHLKSSREIMILRDGSETNIQSWVFDKTGKNNGILTNSSFHISVMQAHGPSHPQQGALYYRILSYKSQKSVCCIWDNESRTGGDKAVINFAKDCDVMIHDTQYTSLEYDDDKTIVQGFGHSTYEMAMKDAYEAKAKKLYCIHYNPTHTDKFLDDIYKTYYVQYPGAMEMAKEGMEVEV